jgi:hypothetical protein
MVIWKGCGRGICGSIPAGLGVAAENKQPPPPPPSQDRQSSGRNLDPGALEYEAGVF